MLKYRVTRTGFHIRAKTIFKPLAGIAQEFSLSEENKSRRYYLLVLPGSGQIHGALYEDSTGQEDVPTAGQLSSTENIKDNINLLLSKDVFSKCLKRTLLKGAVSRDFRPLFFLMNRTHLDP